MLNCFISEAKGDVAEDKEILQKTGDNRVSS